MFLGRRRQQFQGGGADLELARGSVLSCAENAVQDCSRCVGELPDEVPQWPDQLVQPCEGQFRLALDSSGDMILLIERKTMRYVDVNQTVCNTLGYSRDELLKMGPQDLLPVSRAELEKAYDKLIAMTGAGN